MRSRPPASLLLALALAAPLAAQRPSPDDYLAYLPATPRIVARSVATGQLRLYGDTEAPEYRDVDPRDGVDDRRARRLLALAEEFSPILRRNTLNVPREVEAYLGNPGVLHVDTWLEERRVSAVTIDLGPPLDAGGDGDGTERVAPQDAALDSLLRELSPRRPRPAVAPAEGEAERVLYLDFPGSDERGWHRENGHRDPMGSRLYVHPFVQEVSAPGCACGARYQLLLQYWTFYGYNDGANNHEGDWEHLTVSVTTRGRAREHGPGPHEHGLLSAADIAAILDPDAPTPLDSLRIRAVAYYFHNNVLVLDYLAPEAGEPLEAQGRSADGAKHVWEDAGFMVAALRRRLTLAGGRLATHPIGYIGGNDKGMDELLQARPRFLGSLNRDSHGIYPFPGVWRKVGPLDATEKIWGDVVPRVRRDSAGEVDAARPWYDLVADERYLVYRAGDLTLLPDWERLEPLVRDDPVVRRRWFWLIAPVHLGFPATLSPGAGALRRVDLGNVAPLAPTYNSAWNHAGATATYREYTPTVLRVVAAPITPLASLQSGWGVLNYPLVLWGLLPGGNVAVTQLLPWVTGGMHLLGAPPARTFVLGDVPKRFTAIGAGVYQQFGGRDFARLLPGGSDPAVRASLEAAEEPTARAPAAGAVMRRRGQQRGSRVWLNLYYGPRISVENTFALGTGTVSYAVEDAAHRPVTMVAGTLDTRELTGGVTYRLPPTTSETLRLYLRGGYAWTDYSLHAVTLDAQPLPDADRRGGYMLTLLPSRHWWPNTAYAGLGLELASPTRRWILQRLGYGVRLEGTGLLHRLRPAGDCDDCRVMAERGDLSLLLFLAW